MTREELLNARVARLAAALESLPRDESGRTSPAKAVPLQTQLEQAKRELYDAKEGRPSCTIIS